MTHSDFIERLGGGTVIAGWLSTQTKQKVDREAVYKWRANSVPWRWRGHIALLAREKGVKLPKGFLPGAAQ